MEPAVPPQTYKVHNKYHGTAPPTAKYIGRGSPWGNRYVVGTHGERGECCDLFESEQLPTLDVESLRGYDLVCFCHPRRCHGHSIMRKLYGPEWLP